MNIFSEYRVSQTNKNTTYYEARDDVTTDPAKWATTPIMGAYEDMGEAEYAAQRLNNSTAILHDAGWTTFVVVIA